ncbi:hypothetical protein [Streptomyces noursei]|uniref:hypothetical protein n=1 Tax=Streptomyces noursei TaxID=1971 RepID=UPI00167551B2|nr:hypothetical protein [Streptomyces noursei]MCZ1015872.1 hypothetical protein [Streptomyces noursei]GGW91346.1 hypothetical protein GCM10010341_10600 [Streptomyces noursei]
MTVLRLADAGEAADLAAFLARLIHYDRGAAVRLQAGGGVLAVFGRPPSFEVLAIRTARLAADAAVADADADAGDESGAGASGRGRTGGSGLDVTVSAGELLEGVHEAAGSVTVPAAVTGPPWAGVLPPRGGWTRVPGLPSPEALTRAVSAAVAEFRARDEELPPQRRTRPERDRIGREIWSRTLGDTELPLRAVHAAQALGFLRGARAGAMAASASAGVASGAGAGAGVGAAPGTAGTASGTAGAAGAEAPGPALALLAAGGWLRLSTPYGSIAVRVAGPAGATGLSGLTVTPV